VWGAPSRTASCLGENTLAAFAEGRLEGDARRAVEEHVADCPDCRAILATAAGVAFVPSPPSGAPWTDDIASEPLSPGTRVGRYVIEALIGHGAMGTVYAAHDPDLDRKVAVKLLRAESLSDAARQRMRARLLREAKAMARLSHPEVITVYDVGTFGDQLFVAMEHVDGSTLRHWRAAQHRSYAEIMAVYERAGSGLAAAHEAGLVHRDFKPDNVLIGRDGRVRVMDFGLARSEDSGETPPGAPASDDRADERREVTTLTRTGALLGTPAYMAPEQLRGNSATTRSDVFSFCVALYEALYGERPFAGGTLVELQTAIERRDVRPLPIMTRVPGWVRANLLRGLQPSPDARFASMRALLDALRLAHVRARRRLVNALAAGAALIGLLVVAAVSLRVGSAARRDASPRPTSASSFAAPLAPPADSGLAASSAPTTDLTGPDPATVALGGAETQVGSETASVEGPARPRRSPTAATAGPVRPHPAPAASTAPWAAEGAPASTAAFSTSSGASSMVEAPRRPIVGNNGALILE